MVRSIGSSNIRSMRFGKRRNGSRDMKSLTGIKTFPVFMIISPLIGSALNVYDAPTPAPSVDVLRKVSRPFRFELVDLPLQPTLHNVLHFGLVALHLELFNRVAIFIQ